MTTETTTYAVVVRTPPGRADEVVVIDQAGDELAGAPLPRFVDGGIGAPGPKHWTAALEAIGWHRTGGWAPRRGRFTCTVEQAQQSSS
jgi:hypothetical protein